MLYLLPMESLRCKKELQCWYTFNGGRVPENFTLHTDTHTSKTFLSSPKNPFSVSCLCT